MTKETEPTTEETEGAAIANLSDEQRQELVSAIANDIYTRSTFAQVIQLIQTQCTNQAIEIVKNASAEEIDTFLETLKTNKEGAAAKESPEG